MNDLKTHFAIGVLIVAGMCLFAKLVLGIDITPVHVMQSALGVLFGWLVRNLFGSLFHSKDPGGDGIGD